MEGEIPASRRCWLKAQDVSAWSFAPHGGRRLGRLQVSSSRMIEPTAPWPTMTLRPERSSAVTREPP